MIYSRAQWGADESMRDGSPSYFEVHGGFVHHTVNANDYKRKDVPAIIRSIYAYHTQSRGWSDIGYNFLVDRFGRIWEGRYGGVDRPVVGAHTLNYNSYSFAMSAIGNFELVQPSAADAPGVRRPDGVEAVAARRLRRLDDPADRQQELPGDQRPPRRRVDGVPGQVPLRQDPRDPPPRGGRRRPTGPDGTSSATSSALTAARPGRPPGQRRARARAPDRAERRRDVRGRQAGRHRV